MLSSAFSELPMAPQQPVNCHAAAAPSPSKLMMIIAVVA